MLTNPLNAPATRSVSREKCGIKSLRLAFRERYPNVLRSGQRPAKVEMIEA